MSTIIGECRVDEVFFFQSQLTRELGAHCSLDRVARTVNLNFSHFLCLLVMLLM